MWPAIGMVAAGVAGSAISGGLSYASAREAHRESIQAYQNRHQWQVADLRKAGLNPILSATGGAPPAPSMSPTQIPDMGPATAKGMAARLNQAQVATESQKQNLLDIEAQKEVWNTASARMEVYFNSLAEKLLSGQGDRLNTQEKLFAAGRAATMAGISPGSAVSSAAGLIGKLTPAGRAASVGKQATRRY